LKNKEERLYWAQVLEEIFARQFNPCDDLLNSNFPFFWASTLDYPKFLGSKAKNKSQIGKKGRHAKCSRVLKVQVSEVSVISSWEIF
jgi:hypothetical protein